MTADNAATLTVKDVYLAALLFISGVELFDLLIEGTPPLGVFVFARSSQASLIIAKYHSGQAMSLNVRRFASVVREFHQAIKLRKAS